MKKNIDIVNGKLFPSMIAFAIPLVLSGVLQTLYNAADSLILGRFESSNALGAVGSVGPILNVFLALFTGISAGTNIVIARYKGAGDEKRVKKTSDTAIVTALISGTIVGLMGFLLSRWLVNFFGIDEELVDMAVLYMQIYFLGMPFVSLYNFVSSTMRGIGDAKNPMLALVISGASNVFMNVIFVKSFGMGVAGVAIATVLSQLFGFLILVVMLKKSEIGLSFRRLRFDKGIFVKMFRIGFPTGIQGIAFNLSNSIAMSAVNSFGAAAATGNAVVSQVEAIAWVALNAIGLAATTFVSQYIGAGKGKEIGKIMKNGMIISFVIGLVLSIAFYSGRNILTTLFAPGDAEVAKFVMIKATYVMLPYFLVTLLEVPSGMLRGIGATFVSMVGSIFCVCGIRWLWILLFFPMVKTIEFLYLCFPVSWVATGIMYIIMYRIYKKKIDKGEELSF